MNFFFIASDNFNLNDFKDVEKFADAFPDFQTVVLKNEQELNLLLKLIGIKKTDAHELKASAFTKYWNISECYLPEFNDEEFELFYKKWLAVTGRDNNMDEFGNLIFLQGMSPKWNKMTYRLIVKNQ